MSLRYEPSSEPFHISGWWTHRVNTRNVRDVKLRIATRTRTSWLVSGGTTNPHGNTEPANFRLDMYLERPVDTKGQFGLLTIGRFGVSARVDA